MPLAVFLLGFRKFPLELVERIKPGVSGNDIKKYQINYNQYGKYDLIVIVTKAFI